MTIAKIRMIAMNVGPSPVVVMIESVPVAPVDADWIGSNSVFVSSEFVPDGPVGIGWFIISLFIFGGPVTSVILFALRNGGQIIIDLIVN